jgi:hypothetical protein
MVFAGLDCTQIRAKQGTETTDVRQREDDRFTVHIRWDCHAVRVHVQGADGRLASCRAASRVLHRRGDVGLKRPGGDRPGDTASGAGWPNTTWFAPTPALGFGAAAVGRRSDETPGAATTICGPR